MCVSTICDVCVLQHLNHLITPFTQANHTHHTQITLDHSHHTQTFHCFTPFTQPSHTTQHSHTTHRKQPKLPFGLRMSGRSGAGPPARCELDPGPGGNRRPAEWVVGSGATVPGLLLSAYRRIAAALRRVRSWGEKWELLSVLPPRAVASPSCCRAVVSGTPRACCV